MLIEKDKEFDKLIKKGKNMDKMDFLRLVFLSGCDVGKRQRNTEVKKAIIKWANEEKELGNKGWRNLVLRTKRKLLQKLGLGG